VSISVAALLEVHFAFLYQGRELFAKYCIIARAGYSIHVQETTFDILLCLDMDPEDILSSVLEELFAEVESLTEHQKKAY